MNTDELISVSPLTGTVYAVTEYDQVEDGKIVAKEKRELERHEHDIKALHGPARRVYEKFEKE
jgi:hypothetical protein